MERKYNLSVLHSYELISVTPVPLLCLPSHRPHPLSLPLVNSPARPAFLVSGEFDVIKYPAKPRPSCGEFLHIQFNDGDGTFEIRTRHLWESLQLLHRPSAVRSRGVNLTCDIVWNVTGQNASQLRSKIVLTQDLTKRKNLACHVSPVRKRYVPR